MRKKLLFLCIALLCLSLCACGKSEAVKNVEAMVQAIDTISIETLDAAYAAIEAYNDLLLEEREDVEGYDAMTDKLDSFLTEKVTGVWVYEPTYFYNVEEMYEKSDLALNADGNAKASHVEGPWRVEDGVIRIDSGKADYVYYIPVIDGKLRVGSTQNPMIPAEEYKALLDAMFVTVEITPENVSDYCEIVIYTEIEKDDFGVINGDTSTYATLANKVLDQGLLFFEESDDMAIELLVPEHTYKYQSHGGSWHEYTDEADTCVIKSYPYASHGFSLGNKNVKNEYESIHNITADQISFGRVTGKITFIRSEFVKEVKKSENFSSRVLVLYNDIEENSGMWLDDFDY